MEKANCRVPSYAMRLKLYRSDWRSPRESLTTKFDITGIVALWSWGRIRIRYNLGQVLVPGRSKIRRTYGFD